MNITVNLRPGSKVKPGYGQAAGVPGKTASDQRPGCSDNRGPDGLACLNQHGTEVAIAELGSLGRGRRDQADVDLVRVLPGELADPLDL
jgi:hypothetical protein